MVSLNTTTQNLVGWSVWTLLHKTWSGGQSGDYYTKPTSRIEADCPQQSTTTRFTYSPFHFHPVSQPTNNHKEVDYSTSVTYQSPPPWCTSRRGRFLRRPSSSGEQQHSGIYVGDVGFYKQYVKYYHMYNNTHVHVLVRLTGNVREC